MSSGRRQKRSQPACPRPLANPAQSPYLALWRVRTPLAPGDPASATKSYQKPRACSALATPSIRTDELFRLETHGGDKEPWLFMVRRGLWLEPEKIEAPAAQGRGRASSPTTPELTDLTLSLVRNNF